MAPCSLLKPRAFTNAVPLPLPLPTPSQGCAAFREVPPKCRSQSCHTMERSKGYTLEISSHLPPPKADIYQCFTKGCCICNKFVSYFHNRFLCGPRVQKVGLPGKATIKSVQERCPFHSGRSLQWLPWVMLERKPSGFPRVLRKPLFPRTAISQETWGRSEAVFRDRLSDPDSCATLGPREALVPTSLSQCSKAGAASSRASRCLARDSVMVTTTSQANSRKGLGSHL